MQQVEVTTCFWSRYIALNININISYEARGSFDRTVVQGEHRSIDKSVPTRANTPVLTARADSRPFVSFESLFTVRYSGTRSWGESQAFNLLLYVRARLGISGDYTRDIGHLSGISLLICRRTLIASR